ncbi:S41 family peptidase [Flavobacterium coralii]|uniref:S41 family peptidase n=1 Tax=Flavobacterium coralii TaxID=2838017 RepID=UPI000C45D6FC|nr:peptidase S41 [Flavobacterium sp.]|tara:strand:+ start:25476 stop:26924 length:1449 start_codon:yes stop_codon:yes gene_type:complete
MKKIRILLAALVVSALAFQGCEDMDDNAVPVNDFIWKGLNLYYLWQPEVPELADDRFANQAQLNDYLEVFSSPESLFNNLLYQRGVIDRFSVIFSDYRVLENALQGVVKSNGVEFGLVYYPNSETQIFGYVRYILPESDAAGKDIQRGDIFYAVDGTALNVDNYQSLLSRDTYTLNLATYNGGNITPTDESVTLTKTEYAENPVYTTNVVTEDENVIGYLMYNGFFSNYDDELNAAIGQLKAQGINELVLDLRYNSGGSVRTATYLASMITGQFNGDLFAQEQWNPKLQAYFQDENPAALQDRFTNQLSNGAAINNLNLTTVYILTTRSTASASELIINCLRPYIDVVVIGDVTTGKNVGSVTLYDSPNFSKNNVSGSHTYAMQPIVLRINNAEGFGEYSSGLEPDLLLKEDFDNLGVLGSPDEPLFAAAINIINGNGRFGFFPQNQNTKLFKDSKNMRRFGTEMYIEDTPAGGLNLLKDLQ